MPSRAMVLLMVAGALAWSSTAWAQTPDQQSSEVLYHQLEERFRTSLIQVQSGDLGPTKVVQITFSDSAFFDLSRPQRLQTARTVAEFVRDNYADYKRLSAVLIMWSHKSSDGTIESFMAPFEVGDLAVGRSDTKSQ